MLKIQDKDSLHGESFNSNDKIKAGILLCDGLIKTCSDTLSRIGMLEDEIRTLKEELIVTKIESDFHQSKCCCLEQQVQHLMQNMSGER